VRSFPGWFQDPTGRPPERYFDGNGLPTQLVRSNGREFLAVGPSVGVDAANVIPSAPIPPAPYRESAGDQYHWPSPSESSAAPPTEAPAVEIRTTRIWWLVGVLCLLAILFAGSIVTAFEQHQDAQQWQSRDSSEVTRYQIEVRKNVDLYADLAATATALSGDESKEQTVTAGGLRREQHRTALRVVLLRAECKRSRSGMASARTAANSNLRFCDQGATGTLCCNASID
jgi:hypothetical protein